MSTLSNKLKKQNKKQNSLKNLKKFGIDKPVPIPSPESKSAGWERRRQRLAIMDTLTKYMNLTKKQFIQLIEDIKKNPDKYTMQEVILSQYITKANNKDSFLLDWIDRNVEKAPIKTEVTGNEGAPLLTTINVNIIDKPDE